MCVVPHVGWFPGTRLPAATKVALAESKAKQEAAEAAAGDRQAALVKLQEDLKARDAMTRLCGKDLDHTGFLTVNQNLVQPTISFSNHRLKLFGSQHSMSDWLRYASTHIFPPDKTPITQIYPNK